MKALILAAGLGTRLRPLTTNRAKPSLPVLGIPSLWFGAWHLKRELGLSEFAINLSHAPETVRAACEDEALKKFTGIAFHYSDESDGILGSSGALWKLKDWIGSSLLAVSNGDSISFPAWKKMLEFHKKSGAALTIHARSHSQSLEAYTDIKTDQAGKVTAFGEKAASGMMFSGSYLLEPALLSRLPAGASELRPSLLEPLVKEGKLFAFKEDIDWFDTGTIQSYAQTQLQLLRSLPEAKELVQVKMREESREAWVPRDWSHTGQPALVGPVVLTGSHSEWATAAMMLGPRFIGIEPPLPGVKIPTRDALVSAFHFEKI